MSEQEKGQQYERHRVIYDDLKARGYILFETVIGSQAHGTSTPKSDVDTCFVYMAPVEWLYVRSNYHEHLRLSKDCVGYELEHFLGLIATNNPTVMEMIFVPEDCWIMKHRLYDLVLSQKDKFLSKVSKNSYLGYVTAQIRKAKGMDKFQNWDKERTVKKDPIDFCWVVEKGVQFGNTNYGTIPLRKFMEKNGMEEWELGVTSVDHAPNTYALFHMRPEDTFKGVFGKNSDQILFSSIPKDREVDALMIYNQDAFKMHNADWKRYSDWKVNSNKDRWVDTKSGNSIDAKNIMHLVRLMQMNREIASGQGCVVRRPNRDELLSIRNGERDLDEIITWSQKEEKDIVKLYHNSDLPEAVDMELIKSLLLGMRESFYDMVPVPQHKSDIIQYDNCFLHRASSTSQ